MPTEEPTTTVLDSTTTETTGTTTGEPDDGTTTIRIFWSVAMSRVCQRNDCGEGFVGQEVTYALEEGAEYSLLSQADADAGAVANLDENCQANANKNGGCLPLYYNTEITGACTRDNCEAGYEGAPVPYAVPAGMFQSVVSQADAQAQAQAYYEANCQANANANGECFLIEVGNDQQCGSAQKNNCGSCQYGNTVQLCVGANTYFAATKAEANQLALNYINANKQAYANSHGTCSNIDDSDWVATGIAKCSSNSATADGTGSNRYKEEVDNGSCSSTSGQTRWVSDGQCPATTTTTTQIPCTYGINFGADADECGTPHILGSGGSVSGSTWLNKCSTISSCSSNSSWLSVSCSGGGVTVSASANPSSDKRYGTVNIAWADGFSGNYSVTQEPNGVEIRSGC
jgi:hypothetical protein